MLHAPRPTRRARRYALAALGALLAMPTAAALPAAAAMPDTGTEPDLPVPFIAPANGFDWSLAPRYSDDEWRQFDDTSRDYPPDWLPETYNPRYVHPAEFQAVFNGCPTEAEQLASSEGQPTTNTYEWTFPDEVRSVRTCEVPKTFTSQGAREVGLRVLAPDGRELARHRQTVTVRDILVAVVGDSYGAGEGAPHTPRSGVSDDSPGAVPATWADRRCHRSKLAGSAVAARRLEESDPHTTVTFISFACSGATLVKAWGTSDDPADPYAESGVGAGSGITGPYWGVEPPPGASALPSQVDQLKAAVGTRPVDVLLVSGGGNDAGFSLVATTCVMNFGSWCQYTPVAGGKWSLQEQLLQDVRNISSGYDRLKFALGDAGVQVNRGFALEYPSPMRDERGEPCREILEDLLPGPSPILTLALPAIAVLYDLAQSQLVMQAEEVLWADTYAQPKINHGVMTSAQRIGFGYIGGIAERFTKHGYCSASPWYRRAVEASLVQGPFGPLEQAGFHVRTKGVLHPTVEGYRAYADAITPVLLDAVRQPAGGPTITSEAPTITLDAARSSMVPGRNGWYQLAGPVFVARSGAVIDDPKAKNGIGRLAVRINGVDCPPTDCHDRVVTRGEVRSHLELDPGINRIEITATDWYGASTTETMEIKVDPQPPAAPSLTVSAGSPGGVDWWYGPSMAVTLDAPAGWADDVSGPAGLAYSVNGAPFVPAASGHTITLEAEGLNTVVALAYDGAGNVGRTQQTFRLGRPGAQSTVVHTCDAVPFERSAELERVSTPSFPGQPYPYLADLAPAPETSTHFDGYADRASGALGLGMRASVRVDAPVSADTGCTGSSSYDTYLTIGAGSTGLAVGDPVRLDFAVHADGVLTGDAGNGTDRVNSFQRLNVSYSVTGTAGDGVPMPLGGVGLGLTRSNDRSPTTGKTLRRERELTVTSNVAETVYERDDATLVLCPTPTGCSVDQIPDAETSTSLTVDETHTFTVEARVGDTLKITADASGLATATGPGASSNIDFRNTVTDRVAPAAGFDGLALATSPTTVPAADDSAPVVTATVTPAANANGWHNVPASVSFSVSDPDSSVASGVGCAPATVATDTTAAGETFVCSALNASGVATTRAVTVLLDTVAPSVALDGVVAGATYRVGEVPVAECRTTDALSGVERDATVTVTGGDADGVGSITATCAGGLDAAGNEAPPVSVTYVVAPTVAPDTTPASISPSITPAPNAAGWHRTPVSVTFDVADPESDVASSAGCDPTTVVSDTSGTVVTCEATNGAQLTSAASVTVRLDTAAPVVEVRGVAPGATYTAGSVPAASCTASDALSGIAQQPTLSTSSAAADGTGTITATCAGASDMAGNHATAVSVTYTVEPAAPALTFLGFRQPVDPLPAVNRVKAGAAVPVKFDLGGDHGLDVLRPGFPASQRISCPSGVPVDTIEQTVSASTSSLRYDAASGLYVYTWKTDRAWTGQCRALLLTFADGTTATASFHFH